MNKLSKLFKDDIFSFPGSQKKYRLLYSGRVGGFFSYVSVDYRYVGFGGRNNRVFRTRRDSIVKIHFY